MTSIEVRPLRDDLPFGARITGITWQNINDAAVRKQINDVFEDRGMIVFEDIEASSKMQVAVSNIFGPLKDHPVKTVARVNQDAMPGVIEMTADVKSGTLVEIDGKQLTMWQPWHFDHCYNNELNRAGVLRSVVSPEEGGLTGFIDGIELYKLIPPELRKQIEGKNIIYTLDLRYTEMRFGIAKGFRQIKERSNLEIIEFAKTLPRAIHPAVWTRKTGEKVMHISPWMAVGIEGQENAAGDELFETVCQEIVKKAHPYFHNWKPNDMVVWDNWRMLHKANGIEPQYKRCMHRTTIKGDYGLGHWEKGAKGPATAAGDMM